MKAKGPGRTRVTAFCSLAVVFILATYLRFTGITSGIADGYSHNRNFQPDEFVSLRGLLAIDIRAGKLRAPWAYFEGTFNYYLWELPIAIRESFSHRTHHPATYSDKDAKFALLSGRIMTVLFDLLTIWILFLILREIGQPYSVSVLGAFFYSIVPMQVIYAHFMRTHILSNLLCALVLLLSLRAIKTPAWWRYFIIGFIGGLGAATRYPVGVILSIPILLLLFRPLIVSQKETSHLWAALRSLIAGPLWWLASGGMIGLFLGHPYLFIDSQSVYKMVVKETFKYVPSDAGNLSHFFPVWNYISSLIPYAMFPLLWILAYGAPIYLCFCRRWRYLALSLIVFSLLYTVPMSKAYLAPFARQVLLLVPGLCVMIALVVGDLWQVTGWSRTLRTTVIIMLVALTAPSLMFDLAYVRAMQRGDVRAVLRHDLDAAIGKGVSTINVSEMGNYFYTVMPAVDPLNGKNVTVTLHDDTSPADYFVIGFERPLSPAQLTSQIKAVEKNGNFKYVREYYSPPAIAGRRIDLSHFPPDMIYPFPTILLFRAATRG